MMLNPRDEYMKNMGKKEIAKELLKEEFSIEKISQITKLSEAEILDLE